MPGQLFGWGDNSSGQLGLGAGDTTDRLSPTLIDAEPWTALDGGLHSLGIKQDGTLWSWGGNSEGQLGLGDQVQREAAAQVGSSTWVKVAARGVSSAAIRSDQTLWTWGQNSNGKLGLGDTTRRTSPALVGSGWLDVSLGNFHGIGIKTDGTLWGWGLNSSGQVGDSSTTQRTSPVQVGSGTDWVAVSAGAFFSLGLKADGTLWGWGNNGFASLGQGGTDTTNRTSPVQIGTGAWASMSAGFNSAYAIRPDGTLWAWGGNALNQLGQGSGDTALRYSPTQIGSALWAVVRSKDYFVLAEQQDGTLWAWGQNADGQLGQGDNTQLGVPTQIAGADPQFFAVGNSFALSFDGPPPPPPLFWTDFVKTREVNA